MDFSHYAGSASQTTFAKEGARGRLKTKKKTDAMPATRYLIHNKTFLISKYSPLVHLVAEKGRKRGSKPVDYPEKSGALRPLAGGSGRVFSKWRVVHWQNVQC
jgi:hypothetical protein